MYYLTSPQVFYEITKQVLKTKKESQKDTGARDTIKVGKNTATKKKKCC